MFVAAGAQHGARALQGMLQVAAIEAKARASATAHARGRGRGGPGRGRHRGTNSGPRRGGRRAVGREGHTEAGFGGQLVPVPDTGDGTGDPVAEAEMSFAELQAKRMSFVRTSWQDRATLGQLLLLVLCNEDLRRALLWVFAHDASVRPDVRSFAARSGVPVPGDHGARPAAGNQAKGAQRSRGQHGTRGHSGQGTCCLCRWSLRAATACASVCGQVLLFCNRGRNPGACPLPDPHALCQGVLISGLAQLWYRALCTYEAWPWPLLRLLHPSTGAEAKAAIAGVFFSVPPCCLDPGFSRPFRALLGELWLGTEAAGTVTVTQMPLQQGSAAWETCVASLVALRDPVARAVLEAVSTELEISVVDVECRHARFRRATTGPGGRPPNFGTVAARAFLRECELLHSQCIGTVPSGLGRGHLHHQLQEAQRALGLPGPEATPASSRKLKANPFLAFRAHCEKAHMSAHKQGLPGPVFGPSPALSVPPSPGSSVAQCSAPESGALSLATASKPRSKEFEQSVAAAYRNLTAADRQHWALAAAANKAGAGTGTGTVVPVCPLQPVQPVNAMARCRKQNCMPLVGNETCFIAETDLAVPCSVPAPSGPSAGDPGTCAPLVQLERQWDTYSYPKDAPPGTVPSMVPHMQRAGPVCSHPGGSISEGGVLRDFHSSPGPEANNRAHRLGDSDLRARGPVARRVPAGHVFSDCPGFLCGPYPVEAAAHDRDTVRRARCLGGRFAGSMQHGFDLRWRWWIPFQFA